MSIPYASMGEQGAHPASPTNRQRIPQGLLDPILRRAAQRFESVDALFDTRVESFADKGEFVEARVVNVNSGKAEVVRACSIRTTPSAA